MWAGIYGQSLPDIIGNVRIWGGQCQGERDWKEKRIEV